MTAPSHNNVSPSGALYREALASLAMLRGSTPEPSADAVHEARTRVARAAGVATACAGVATRCALDGEPSVGWSVLSAVEALGAILRAAVYVAAGCSRYGGRGAELKAHRARVSFALGVAVDPALSGGPWGGDAPEGADLVASGAVFAVTGYAPADLVGVVVDADAPEDAAHWTADLDALAVALRADLDAAGWGSPPDDRPLWWRASGAARG